MKFFAPAVLFAASCSVALAADAPNRVKKPSPPVAASQACKETSGLPTDVFGFTTGSDVGDLRSLGGALEYNGNYGTRFGKLSGHLAKAQLSYVPLDCLEIGPTIQGLSVSADRSTFGFDTRQFGGTIEMKYKIFGRATHGVGLTITTEPGIFHRQYSTGFVDGLGNPFKPKGSVVSNLARVLIDFELIKDKLFGAINLEHQAVWDHPVLGFGGSGYARLSNVNIRAALAYKMTDTFYLGAEASHQRAYTGIFMKNDLGNAWFAGPTFYWQATEKLSVTGAYNYQFAGQTNGFASKGVDLVNFNRHQAKLKLGYSF
jgi:opacity protein-like surface antigen